MPTQSSSSYALGSPPQCCGLCWVPLKGTYYFQEVLGFNRYLCEGCKTLLWPVKLPQGLEGAAIRRLEVPEEFKI